MVKTGAFAKMHFQSMRGMIKCRLSEGRLFLDEKRMP